MRPVLKRSLSGRVSPAHGNHELSSFVVNVNIPLDLEHSGQSFQNRYSGLFLLSLGQTIFHVNSI